MTTRAGTGPKTLSGSRVTLALGRCDRAGVGPGRALQRRRVLARHVKTFCGHGRLHLFRGEMPEPPRALIRGQGRDIFPVAHVAATVRREQCSHTGPGGVRLCLVPG